MKRSLGGAEEGYEGGRRKRSKNREDIGRRRKKKRKRRRGSLIGELKEGRDTVRGRRWGVEGAEEEGGRRRGAGQGGG